MKVGDRIRKRGFVHEGVIEKRRGFWVTIKWDDSMKPGERPMICHVNELEFIE